MCDLRLLYPLVFFGFLSLATPLVRGQLNETRHLAPREGQLLQEWRQRAQVPEAVPSTDVISETQIRDRLSADQKRAGSWRAMDATASQPLSALLEQWRRGGGEMPRTTFKDLLIWNDFHDRLLADQIR